MGTYYNRQTLRRRGHDYTGTFTYFITICTYQKAHLFGEVVMGKMQLSPLGRLAAEEWEKTLAMRDLPKHPFVIMPNHIHMIIALGADANFGFSDWAPVPASFTNAGANSLASIVRGFKSAVTGEPESWMVRLARCGNHDTLKT